MFTKSLSSILPIRLGIKQPARLLLGCLGAISITMGVQAEVALKPLLSDYLKDEPALLQLSEARRAAAVMPVAGQSQFWREKIHQYEVEGDLRRCGLAHFIAAEIALAGQDPAAAIALFMDPSIERNTVLGGLAAEKVLQLVETKPDLAPLASPYFDRVIKNGVLKPVQARRLFELWLEHGDYDRAAGLVSAGGKIGPVKPAADGWREVALARLASVRGQRPAAIGWLKEAVRLPAAADVWDQAMDLGRKIAGQNPLANLLKPPELRRVALALLDRGDGKNAWPCFQQLPDIRKMKKSGAALWLPAGRAAWQAGQPKEALRLLRACIPGDAAGKASRAYLLAQCARRLGDRLLLERSTAALRQAAPKSSEYTSVLQAMAFDAEVDGRDADAVTIYTELSGKLFPADIRSEAHWKLAWLDYTTGKTASADSHFLESFRLDNAREYAQAALYWHGVCRLTSADLAEAAACFQAIRETFPHSYYSALAGSRLARWPAAGPGATTESQHTWQQHLREKYSLPDTNGGVDWFKALPDADRTFVLEAYTVGELAAAAKRLRSFAGPPPQPACALLAGLAREAGDTYQFIYYFNRAYLEFSFLQISDLPRDLATDLFPQKYGDLVQKAMAGSTVDPLLVLALIRQESAFKEDARSVSNAIGLMQILPVTAVAESSPPRQSIQVETELENPQFNIPLGCQYLLKLKRNIDDRTPLALAAYNGGQRRVQAVYQRYQDRLGLEEIIELIPMAQSRNYVKAIFRNYNYYCLIYRGAPADVTAFLGKGNP